MYVVNRPDTESRDSLLAWLPQAAGQWQMAAYAWTQYRLKARQLVPVRLICLSPILLGHFCVRNTTSPPSAHPRANETMERSVASHPLLYRLACTARDWHFASHRTCRVRSGSFPRSSRHRPIRSPTRLGTGTAKGWVRLRRMGGSD